MLELFGANTGNSHRAAIALYEADVPFVSTLVDLRGGGHRTPSFLRLNPAAKVPVLVDPDEPFVLTQSNAIMFHAAERGSSDHLLPGDGTSRARALERFFYFVTDAIVWSGAAFALSNRGQGDAAALLETNLVERLEAAERFIADGPYMAGDCFSLADIAGFTIMRAYRRHLELQPQRPLVQWFERIGARPAVQRGLDAFRRS